MNSDMRLLAGHVSMTPLVAPRDGIMRTSAPETSQLHSSVIRSQRAHTTTKQPTHRNPMDQACMDTCRPSRSLLVVTTTRSRHVSYP